MRKDSSKINQGSVNPTEYMNMSNQSYYQEFERPKGSVYTQIMSEQQSNLEGEMKRTDKAKLYLRGLNFSFIRDSYNRRM